MPARLTLVWCGCRYIRGEREVEALAKRLESGSLSSQDVERLKDILEVGGTRALLFDE